MSQLVYSNELVGVLKLYKQYEIEYDQKNEIIYIHKKIPPMDCYLLRYLLKNVPEEIHDVRVYHERRTYVKNEEGLRCLSRS